MKNFNLKTYFYRILLTALFCLSANSLIFAEGDLTVYASGPYEVWAGNYQVDLDNAVFNYNIDIQPGYTYLGESTGTASFPGGYAYYVIVTKSVFSLDAIILPGGHHLGDIGILVSGNMHLPYKFDSKGNLIGSLSDYASYGKYIRGAPNGTVEEVGKPLNFGAMSYDYRGFVLAVNYPGLILNPDRSIRSRFGHNEEAVGDPIDPVIGNMYVSATDLNLPGKNLNFLFVRTYNSMENILGPLGYGWTHSYNVRLAPDSTGSNMEIRDEEGKGYLFAISYKTNPATYLPKRGEHSTLIQNTTGYIWTKKDRKQYIFDLKGKLTQIKDRNGNTIKLIYNSQNQLTKITDTTGRNIELRYNPQGMISLLDASGRHVEYLYDNQSNLTTVTDPAGNRTSYDYDVNHNLTCKTDARNRSTHFTYDAEDRCTSSSGEGNLNHTELNFDFANKHTAVSGSRHNETTYYYNDDLLFTKITNAEGRSVTSIWDKDLNCTSRTDELGRITKMAYDAKGNLIKLTDPQGNSTTYTYDSTYNFVKSTTDAQGNTTANTYDGKGNLTKITDALGGNTFYTYNAAGQVTGNQNALGKAIYFTYDTNGNLTQTKDALGSSTNLSYDAVGNMTSSKDPRGNTTNFSYDKINQLTQATYTDNSSTSYSYDQAGNRTSVTDPLGKITYYSYDQSGKVRSSTDALGYAINYDYDTEENLACATDQNSNRTSYSYDSLNRLTSQTDALGNTTNYGYDAVGNRTSLTDAKRQTTTYEYDSLNRLVRVNHPDSEIITYTYDSLGRRLTMTDWQGTTTYTYDKLGRLTKVDGPLAKDNFTYTYDALGNRLAMTDPDGKITKYSYDALNRIVFITDPQNKVTTYSYDAAGNQTGITYPNGTKVVYSYDNLNRLITLTNQKAATPFTKISEYTYTYDPAGRRARVNLLDGSSTVYAYDAIGQLTQETNPSPAEPYSITYTYDPAGNRIRKVANNSDSTYSYNSLNQLVKEDIRTSGIAGPKKITVSGAVSDKSFIDQVTVNGVKATLGNDTFTCLNVPLALGKNTITVIATDVLGNSTTTVINVTYEPAAITEQITYSYDSNGNLIEKEEAGKTSNLSYDIENRLISFVSPAVNETYAYDGEGRRVSSSLRGATGAEAISYLYDGMSVALERNSSGTTTAIYIRNPLAPGGIGGIISAVTGTQQNYYHYDGIGTVTALSNITGATTQIYAYDAFGSVFSQSGTATNNRNFLTKESSSTGLIYFGARYYDPRAGRFISRDPSGMSDGPNLYLYCLNDPVNAVDLWGLCKIKTGWFPEFLNYLVPGYRNYGGPSRSGPGAPQDLMDKSFQRHDGGYSEGQLDQADIQLVTDLYNLPSNPSSWGDGVSVVYAQSYRAGAIIIFGTRQAVRQTIRDIHNIIESIDRIIDYYAHMAQAT